MRDVKMHGGCQPGMAKRVGDQPGTGCRHDCLHRANVESYREAKLLADEVDKIARENATGGFPAEVREWRATHPTFTFKQWLIDGRRTREDAA